MDQIFEVYRALSRVGRSRLTHPDWRRKQILPRHGWKWFIVRRKGCREGVRWAEVAERRERNIIYILFQVLLPQSDSGVWVRETY